MSGGVAALCAGGAACPGGAQHHAQGEQHAEREQCAQGEQHAGGSSITVLYIASFHEIEENFVLASNLRNNSTYSIAEKYSRQLL
jgi:hypothetical protein